MSTDLMTQLTEVVEEERERWKIPGIAVGILRDGEIQKEGYGIASLETGCPVTADMLFQIGSNSKVFTTTLLMTLVDEGIVDLDAPVTVYLPDLRLQDAAALDKIIVRHLVSHQSGIWGDVFDDHGWGDDALRVSVEALPNVPHMYQPTELWSYTNVAFNIAGRVIEELLGLPFEIAMRERVLDPLGLTRTFYYAHEVYPYPHAVGHRPEDPGDDDVIVAREYWLNRALNPAGGLHSTAELNRFAGAYRNPTSRVKIDALDDGLRMTAWRIQNDEEQVYPPVAFRPVGEREFMATDGREVGSRLDFILADDGAIRFLRMGGRLAQRQP